MAKEKLTIVGAGPGGEELLSGQAKRALDSAQRILGVGRVGCVDERAQGVTLPELSTALRDYKKGVTAVLVSGDCGFFSIAKTIVRDFSDAYDIELIPGIGSVQVLSAKTQIPYDDAVLISLHGRCGNIVPSVAYNTKVFALAGGENSVKAILSALSGHGLGGVTVSVGERLSYPDERIVTGTADELCGMDFDGLAVMAILNPAAAKAHTPLRDGEFIRGDVPMTKAEVRWLSIQKLAINPGDVVYDIGAGTGAVSVEMARKAYGGFVYAIEAKEEACALVRHNAAKHGAFNMEVIHGEAPDALNGLSAPDKAFIGGSTGRMDGIVAKLLEQNPRVRIAATAITLQGLQQALAAFEKHGLANTECVCVNIAKAKKAGGYDMMLAQNPVYIISGGGHE